MFTGLIEDIGIVRAVLRRGRSARLVVSAGQVLEDLRPGDSISIDGACQTVVDRSGDRFSVDSLAETLKKTTLGNLTVGSRVNLERALLANARLGGHLVQGHVGGIGSVRRLRREGRNTFLVVELPPELRDECVPEGSIAVNGVSLTIANADATSATINIIPETLRRTTLGELTVGDTVNVETDILGRYVKHLLARYGEPDAARRRRRETPGLTTEHLAQWGYTGETT